MDVAAAEVVEVAYSRTRDNEMVVVLVADHIDADAGSPLQDNSNDVDVVQAVWR